jgi:hypothetical protein
MQLRQFWIVCAIAVAVDSLVVVCSPCLLVVTFIQPPPFHSSCPPRTYRADRSTKRQQRRTPEQPYEPYTRGIEYGRRNVRLGSPAARPYCARRPVIGCWLLASCPPDGQTFESNTKVNLNPAHMLPSTIPPRVPPESPLDALGEPCPPSEIVRPLHRYGLRLFPFRERWPNRTLPGPHPLQNITPNAFSPNSICHPVTTELIKRTQRT